MYGGMMMGMKDAEDGTARKEEGLKGCGERGHSSG